MDSREGRVIIERWGTVSSHGRNKVKEVIDSQPRMMRPMREILRELAFERMVERGLMDSR